MKTKQEIQEIINQRNEIVRERAILFAVLREGGIVSDLSIDEKFAEWKKTGLTEERIQEARKAYCEPKIGDAYFECERWMKDRLNELTVEMKNLPQLTRKEFLSIAAPFSNN